MSPEQMLLLIQRYVNDKLPQPVDLYESQPAAENTESVTFRYGGYLFLGPSENVFKMYEQLNNGSEGQGLGLFLINKIINASGGKVGVESGLNVGTEFRLYIKKEQSQDINPPGFIA